jgi:hypothetical protein
MQIVNQLFAPFPGALSDPCPCPGAYALMPGEIVMPFDAIGQTQENDIQCH